MSLEIVTFIVLILLAVTGILFILQKLFFIVTQFLGMTLGSISSGFVLMFAITLAIKYLFDKNAPFLPLLFIASGMIINYLLDKKNLQYEDKVYIEGGIIGYIIWLVLFYFKANPSLWF